MFILGNLIIGLTQVLDSLLFVYTLVIFASVIISWLHAPAYNPIVKVVHQLTTPVYSMVQKKIPTTFGALDLTPIILLLGISIVRAGILPSLTDIGLRMKF